MYNRNKRPSKRRGPPILLVKKGSVCNKVRLLLFPYKWDPNVFHRPETNPWRLSRSSLSVFRYWVSSTLRSLHPGCYYLLTNRIHYRVYHYLSHPSLIDISSLTSISHGPDWIRCLLELKIISFCLFVIYLLTVYMIKSTTIKDIFSSKFTHKYFFSFENSSRS